MKLEVECPTRNASLEPASSGPILKLPIAKLRKQPVACPQEKLIALSEITKECELPPPTQRIQRLERSEQVQTPANLDTGEKIVKTLCQVINTLKIEYKLCTLMGTQLTMYHSCGILKLDWKMMLTNLESYSFLSNIARVRPEMPFKVVSTCQFQRVTSLQRKSAKFSWMKTLVFLISSQRLM